MNNKLFKKKEAKLCSFKLKHLPDELAKSLKIFNIALLGAKKHTVNEKSIKGLNYGKDTNYESICYMCMKRLRTVKHRTILSHDFIFSYVNICFKYFS